MKLHFMVRTKPGDVHPINGKPYEVVKVKRLKRGWAVEVKKR